MRFNTEPEKKKLTLRLSLSALVERFFGALQTPTQPVSSEFQALTDLVAKVPPKNEEAFDPEDPFYKTARAQRYESGKF
jgi:hypothetical protein